MQVVHIHSKSYNVSMAATRLLCYVISALEDSPAVSISCHANATGTTPNPATGTGEDMRGNRRKKWTFYIKKPVKKKKNEM